MGRSPCCAKAGLNRGAWTASEDKILTDYITVHGEGKWRHLPKLAGLKRCGKSCRLRWLNYLRPNIKRDDITSDEEELIIRLHKLLGNRWSLIAGRLPGRTDNQIKNYWNTVLAKKVFSHSQLNSNTKLSRLTKSSDAAEKQKTKKSDKSLNVVRTKAVKLSATVFSPQDTSHKNEPMDHKPLSGKHAPVDDINIMAKTNEPLLSDGELGSTDGVFTKNNSEEHNQSISMNDDFGFGGATPTFNAFTSDFFDSFDFDVDYFVNNDSFPSSDGPPCSSMDFMDDFTLMSKCGYSLLT